MERAYATTKPTRRRSRLAIVFAVLGALLVAAAVALALYNLNYSQTAGQRAADDLAHVEGQLPPIVLADYKAPSGNLPSVQVGGRSYAGIVEIEALGVKLPVAGNEPAQGSGGDFAPYVSSYDSASGAIVIGGANYASQFGRIGELATGDAVVFTDMSGRVRTCAVATVATVGADDAQALRDTCADWPLCLHVSTFSGMQRTVVCCQGA